MFPRHVYQGVEDTSGAFGVGGVVVCDICSREENSSSWRRPRRYGGKENEEMGDGSGRGYVYDQEPQKTVPAPGRISS